MQDICTLYNTYMYNNTYKYFFSKYITRQNIHIWIIKHIFLLSANFGCAWCICKWFSCVVYNISLVYVYKKKYYNFHAKNSFTSNFVLLNAFWKKNNHHLKKVSKRWNMVYVLSFSLFQTSLPPPAPSPLWIMILHFYLQKTFTNPLL